MKKQKNNHGMAAMRIAVCTMMAAFIVMLVLVATVKAASLQQDEFTPANPPGAVVQSTVTTALRLPKGSPPEHQSPRLPDASESILRSMLSAADLVVAGRIADDNDGSYGNLARSYFVKEFEVDEVIKGTATAGTIIHVTIARRNAPNELAAAGFSKGDELVLFLRDDGGQKVSNDGKVIGKVFNTVDIDFGVQTSSPDRIAHLKSLMQVEADTKASRGTGGSPEKAALHSKLIADGPKFAAGQPVMLKLEIGNTGDVARHFEGPTVPYNSPFIVLNAEGRQAPYIGGFGQVASGEPKSLDPGKLFETAPFDLANSYYLRVPGRYTVRWNGEKVWGSMQDLRFPLVDVPPSDELQFEIVPDPAASADGDPIGHLLPLLKSRWFLSSYRAQAGRRLPGADVFGTPGKDFTASAGDVSGLFIRLQNCSVSSMAERGDAWLWLRKEPFNGQTPSSVEDLGRLSRWHVYFNISTNALKDWPTAKDEIVRALNDDGPVDLSRYYSTTVTRFPGSLEPPPDAGWGDAVEGLQVMAASTGDGRPWRSDDTPGLRMAVQNKGETGWQTSWNELRWRLEVDGVWYRVPTNSGKMETISPGNVFSIAEVLLNNRWQRAAPSEMNASSYGSGGGGGIPRGFNRDPLKLASGKHTVRLGVIAQRGPAGNGPRAVLAISKPVEIEIAK